MRIYIKTKKRCIKINPVKGLKNLLAFALLEGFVVWYAFQVMLKMGIIYIK